MIVFTLASELPVPLYSELQTKATKQTKYPKTLFPDKQKLSPREVSADDCGHHKRRSCPFDHVAKQCPWEKRSFNAGG